MTLAALTLNTWAIRGVSDGARATSQRLRGLCAHVRELSPDWVFLQEVWRKPDQVLLRDGCGYPHLACSDTYRHPARIEFLAQPFSSSDELASRRRSTVGIAGHRSRLATSPITKCDRPSPLGTSHRAVIDRLINRG